MDKLEARIANLPKLSGPLNGTGITSFIGGTLRSNTKFSPRYSGSSNKKEDALRIGRRTDHLYQKCVAAGKRVAVTPKTAHAYHAMRSLRQFGIKSVLTQVPVRIGKIVSRLDGLGVYIRNGVPTVAVIELKTTGRALNNERSYTSSCRNKPNLDVLGIPNNEKNAHDIQAEFGRLAFSQCYGAAIGNPPVRSVVVIANSKEGSVREVQPIVTKNDQSLAAIFSTTTITPLLRYNRFSALPRMIDGGNLIRAALLKLGYKKVQRGKGVPAGISFIAFTNESTRTFFGIRPHYCEQTPEQQKQDRDYIKSVVSRSGKEGDRIAIMHRHSGGWAVVIVPRV